MKVTFIKAMALVGTLMLFPACSSSDSEGANAATQTEKTAEQASQIALAAVPGTAGTPTKLDTADEHRWVVEVTLAGGAVVSVEIARATGILEEIKGAKGPFDYDIAAPKPGMMKMSQAKEKALATKAGVVELWEVKPPDNQYEFYVRDADERLWEIKMTADAGAITSVLEKAAVD